MRMRMHMHMHVHVHVHVHMHMHVHMHVHVQLSPWGHLEPKGAGAPWVFAGWVFLGYRTNEKPPYKYIYFFVIFT